MELNSFRFYKRCAEFYDDLYKGEKLPKSKLKEITKNMSALFAKNVYDFDTETPTQNWYIIRDQYYEIDEYPSKNTRKHIRKALSVYEYKKIDKEEMLQNGYQVYNECSDRFDKMLGEDLSFNEYKERLEISIQNGYEFWAGYYRETGEMAMWEALYIKGDMVVESMERLSSRFTKHNPTYGLNHELTRYYLQERGYRYINAGFRSLDGHSNVQSFLIDKFQFRKAYCRIQMYVPLWLKIGLLSLYPIAGILSFFPSFKLSQLFKMFLSADSI